MRAFPLLVMALLWAPWALSSDAAASHGTLFYERDHRWQGTYTPLFYAPTDSFFVPGGLLCYERVTYVGFDQASSFRVVVRDGAGRVLIVDAGATVDVGPVLATPLGPVSGGAYTAGTFTISFQGEGYAGAYTIRILSVANPADCGRATH